MEKAAGVQLFKGWENINELQRLRLIENITKLENQLAAIRFPAYGSLFFRHSVAEESRIILDSSIDPSGSYCIGSACDMPWFGRADLKDSHPDDIRPCKYSSLSARSNIG